MLQDAEAVATGAAETVHETVQATVQKPTEPVAHGPTEAETRAKVLAEFGAASADEVRAAIALAKAAEEAKRSDAEKLASVRAEAESAKKAVASLGDVIRTQLAGSMEALTPDQRAAVIKIAGDDPARQLLTINSLRPTWAAAPVETPKPAANTAPAGKGPSPAGVRVEGDKRAKFEAMRGRDPFLAAQYLAANPSALD